jgi:hypothetical protein
MSTKVTAGSNRGGSSTAESRRDPASGAALAPKHPERICWGCNRYCPDTDLACGNGTIRTPHPIELFGPDWFLWDPKKK